MENDNTENKRNNNIIEGKNTKFFKIFTIKGNEQTRETIASLQRDNRRQEEQIRRQDDQIRSLQEQNRSLKEGFDNLNSIVQQLKAENDEFRKLTKRTLLKQFDAILQKDVEAIISKVGTAVTSLKEADMMAAHFEESKLGIFNIESSRQIFNVYNPIQTSIKKFREEIKSSFELANGTRGILFGLQSQFVANTDCMLGNITSDEANQFLAKISQSVETSYNLKLNKHS